jgi:hypothetical protein
LRVDSVDIKSFNLMIEYSSTGISISSQSNFQSSCSR